MSVTSGLRVLTVATATAWADLTTIYSWKSWLGGWLLRILAQVAFFGLIGRLLDSPETTRYLVVGNAVGIVVIEGMLVVASSSWERASGTLPLLVAAPGQMPLVFVGRSVHWLVDGTACASVAFFTLGAVFDVPLDFPRALLVVPLIALVGTSVYGLGLVLAAVVLKSYRVRNVASNVGYLTLMAITGIQVPVSFWPGWVQGLVQVLPVTHGLQAIRGVIDGASAAVIARQTLLEVVVAVGWMLIALMSFRTLAESGRADGSIEFS